MPVTARLGAPLAVFEWVEVVPDAGIRIFMTRLNKFLQFSHPRR